MAPPVRQRVLFVHAPGNLEPWYSDLVEIIDGRHDVALIDASAALEPQFRDVDVVVDLGGRGTPAMIEAGRAAGVRLWQVLGTGLDVAPVARILEAGIPLANTPGTFSAPAVAEHALFLMLCFAKQHRVMHDAVRNGQLYGPTNEELLGATLGLVGFGASARELARLALAFGMSVLAVDIDDAALAAAAAVGVEPLGGDEELDELLRRSDYVSLHVPLTRETRHLIAGPELALMRPRAVLVNVARGGVVDEDALLAALRAGRLRGAGLDVHSREPLAASDPLLELPNVVATPHVAGTTHGTARRRALATLENLDRLSRGLPPLHLVTEAP
jgi:phosphoglycerate dehydrogenase-like enzyme